MLRRSIAPRQSNEHDPFLIVGGTLGLSDETSDFGYFSLKEMEGLEMLGHHKKKE